MLEHYKSSSSAPEGAVQKFRAAGKPADRFDVELKRRIVGDMPAETRAQPATPRKTHAPVPETHTTLTVPEFYPVSETWEALRHVDPGPNSVLSRLGGSCGTSTVAAFDLLRTQVLQVLRSEGWSRIGIVAPTEGCGTTFTAVNLACGLARIENFRTLLVDLNLRTPGVHRALDIKWGGEIEDFLTGVHHSSQFVVRAADNLGVAMNASPTRGASDLLLGASTATTLNDAAMSLASDVVIYDLPPLLDYDDCLAFAPHLDAVLLIADAEQTRGPEILECERKLSGVVPLLGVVLNNAARR